LADRLAQANGIVEVTDLVFVEKKTILMPSGDPSGEVVVVTASLMRSVVGNGLLSSGGEARLIVRSYGNAIGGRDLRDLRLDPEARLWAVVAGIDGLRSVPRLDTALELLVAVYPDGRVDVLVPDVDVSPAQVAAALDGDLTAEEVLEAWITLLVNPGVARPVTLDQLLEIYRDVLNPESTGSPALILCDHPRIDEFTDMSSRPNCSP